VYSRAEEALTSPEYQDLINQEINRLLKVSLKLAGINIYVKASMKV
jgi:hypothetical protein